MADKLVTTIKTGLSELCHTRSVFTFFLFLTVFSLLILCFQYQKAGNLKQQNYLHKKATPRLARNESINHKRVLFYTTYFDRKIWPHDGVGSSSNLTAENGQQCEYNCLITYNKSDLPNSDAVVFHEADLPRAQTVQKIGAHLYRNPRQRWVYFTHENPSNARNNPAMYNGVFNWTITYRRDSDVFYPNGYYREIQTTPKNFSTNFAEGKDKLIVWLVSNCGQIRDKVAIKLLEFLPITVLGRCSVLFNQATPSFCERGSEKCPPFLKRFKFYLAFENKMCFDYITEKYWDTPFDNNMIPIVLGSNYDAKVAMPGSYINVLDFKSIKDLSNYIKYLDKNDTAYNEYFRWKEKYVRFIPGQESWTCQLCAKLHNTSLPEKIYKDLGTFWGVESNCKSSYIESIKRIISS